MARRVHDVRAIPLWLLREYLVDAGGRAEGGRIVGPRWRATLTELEDYRIGGLAVGQVRLELEGDEDALDAVDAQLAPKLLRGGG
ncbi:MAG TPA: DUF1952 domain-containing protein [Planctomycetota bacterium]|nr:DUF1952 domain-containing protein [Planctomycetota bacterium]